MYRIDQPEMSDEGRERAVEVRLQRQSLLTRRLPPAPNVDIVLSEAVLLQPVCDRFVMVGQLRHLTEVADLPNVSVRVLPLAAGPHHGTVAGGFVLLDFPSGNRNTPEPSIVYSESLTGALYLDRAAEYAAYEKVWASLSPMP